MSKFICPQIIGHRGACHYSPENTKASIELAAKQGAKWVEVDLQLTQDNNIAIIHNPTVNKCTNGKGKVIKMDFAEIAKLDAGSWHSEQYAGQRVLSLEQLLKLVIRLKINVNLEIKSNVGLNEETASIAVKAVKAIWPKDRPLPLFSSYSLTAIETVKEHYPKAPRAMIVGEWNQFVKRAIVDLDCSSINVDRRLITPQRLACMHETGKPVIIHTVNGLASAVKFIEMGVDGLFTDRPGDIIAALQAKGLYRST